MEAFVIVRLIWFFVVFGGVCLKSVIDVLVKECGLHSPAMIVVVGDISRALGLGS